MHRQILLGLRIRHAALLDQPHSLKLELARKLPTLHDAPPVPLKHLTWCLRNRVQANAVRLTALLVNGQFRPDELALPELSKRSTAQREVSKPPEPSRAP